ncbi:protein FAM200C-like [Penaeus vannamei]|uniref:protein FAM200C-like n=1 Tax=Penaeus vannamei TaxID=6689 RepID=UPI00387F3888
MSDDIKEQVVQEIKSAGLFSIQLNESTDIQPCTQLLAFVSKLQNSLKLKILTGAISVGYTQMELQPCWVLSQVLSQVTEKAPSTIPTHCMIHRQALASKTTFRITGH